MNQTTILFIIAGVSVIYLMRRRGRLGGTTSD